MKQLEGTLMGKLRETEAERDALTARLATLEQLNRDLARALVNEDADAVLPPAHQAVADLLYSAWSYARNPQQFNLEVLAEAARAYGATVKP
jgi:hypothetical protein